MKSIKVISFLIGAALLAACGEAPKTNSGNAANTNSANSNTAPTALNLTVAQRPQKVLDLMTARGEQDQATPVLKIIEPKADAALSTSTVKVKLELTGDLKGYQPGMNEDTHTGNHIHVILDNQPYEAYYNLSKEFELRNVLDGDHVLRVFPSRPWHESFKNEGAFQFVKFTIKNGGADPNNPATTDAGAPMSNASATPEVRVVKPSNAGAVDPKKPLLTYSRPKGEYKGDDTNAIMIDFWLSNAKLKDDGGEYRVRYSVDGSEPKYIDKWAPIWVSGFTAGTHNVTLDLLDKDDKVVDNGGYNSTTREITITK